MKKLLLSLLLITFTFTACNQTPPPENSDQVLPEEINQESTAENETTETEQNEEPLNTESLEESQPSYTDTSDANSRENEKCITERGSEGFIKNQTCIAIGSNIPDTDCVITPYGICGAIGLTEGAECTDQNGNLGYAFAYHSGVYCVQVGDTVYDTDCRVGIDGTCARIQ